MKRGVPLIIVGLLICGLAFASGFYANSFYNLRADRDRCERDLRDMGRITDSCIEDLQICESMTDLAEAIKASEVQFGPDSPATKLLRRADDAYSRKEGVR